MNTSDTPSWLAPRNKRAATTSAPQAQTARLATTSPETRPSPGSTKPGAKAPGAVSTAAATKGKGGNPSRPKIRVSRSDDLLGLVTADVEALADRLVAASSRPEVAAIVRPDLPKILQAMIAGAHVAGPAGMGERANLFRLAGLPTERPKGEDDTTKDRLRDVAARLEKAAGMRARLVEVALQPASGHADDTAEGAEAMEAPESLGFGA